MRFRFDTTALPPARDVLDLKLGYAFIPEMLRKLPFPVRLLLAPTAFLSVGGSLTHEMKHALLIATLAGLVLLLSASTCASETTAAVESRIALCFSVDQGFGNGIVVQQDTLAAQRIAEALVPLAAKYRVMVIVNPMVRDKDRLEKILAIFARAGIGFIFDVYSSDCQTLGSCSEQNAPFDAAKGMAISPEQLETSATLYGRKLAGIRFMELFSQDFTIRAVRTTNPEWALPCWKLPTEGFFQPAIAEAFLQVAGRHKLLVQWSDPHWFRFASWDASQEDYETTLCQILRRHPGQVIVSYANNEPEERALLRREQWAEAVQHFPACGAAGYGISNQSWMRKDEMKCPVEDILAWTRRALEKNCSLLQFEPAWYFFTLPRGSFGQEDYTRDPQWSERGNPKDSFRQLEMLLMQK